MKYLFMLVLSQGGFEKVDQLRLWGQVDQKMGFPDAQSAAMSVSRTHYYGLMYVYEQYFIQRRPVSQLIYPINWYRGQPAQTNAQQHARSAPPTPQSAPTANAPLPRGQEKAASLWQQLSLAAKPFRVPTTLHDLGTTSLKTIHQMLICGIARDRVRALNILQCLVHPGRLNDKDIVISLPPNAPFLLAIVQSLLSLHREESKTLARTSMSDLHLQVLGQRLVQPPQRPSLDIIENILRGMACGEGRSSLVLFDPRLQADLLSFLVDNVCSPLCPQSFTNNLVILSRLCSGISAVDDECVGRLVDLLNQELDFVGPLVQEIAAHPRFGMSSYAEGDDSDKTLHAAQDRIAFLANYIPGHIYLLLSSLCLLLLNHQDTEGWRGAVLSGRLNELVSHMFHYIVAPLFPSIATYLLALRQHVAARPGKQTEALGRSLKDGGYMELVLTVTVHSLRWCDTITDMDVVVPALLRLMGAVFAVYRNAKAKDAEAGAGSPSDTTHPLTVWRRAGEVLQRLSAGDPVSCSTCIISNGFFEPLFSWLSHPIGSSSPTATRMLTEAIDACFSLVVQF